MSALVLVFGRRPRRDAPQVQLAGVQKAPRHEVAGSVAPGRATSTAGDSVLAEFGSAVEAVQCAVEAQTALAEANASLAPDRRRNAEVVEAFCPVAASRSNTHRSIHQPPVAALHAPAEMPTALSSVPLYAEIHVASCSRRAYHRERRRHATLIAPVAPNEPGSRAVRSAPRACRPRQRP
jgi:hypothetical protein